MGTTASKQHVHVARLGINRSLSGQPWTLQDANMQLMQPDIVEDAPGGSHYFTLTCSERDPVQYDECLSKMAKWMESQVEMFGKLVSLELAEASSNNTGR